MKLDIGRGLVFYLRASNDPVIEGWHIAIIPKEGPYDDYAWLLNPPYRSYNATEVSASYDFTAKDAIQYGPRELRFPLNAADANRALELYYTIESSTGSRFNEAVKEMETIPSGKAVFKIIDAKLGKSGPENNGRGRINWLKFELVIILPSSRAGKDR